MMLEITFRSGRPLAGYLHFAKKSAKARATRELAPNLVGDFGGRGELLGLEVLAFDKATLSRINRVLASCGVEPLAERELATLRAA
jgi:hypothetical protein